MENLSFSYTYAIPLKNNYSVFCIKNRQNVDMKGSLQMNTTHFLSSECFINIVRLILNADINPFELRTHMCPDVDAA